MFQQRLVTYAAGCCFVLSMTRLRAQTALSAEQQALIAADRGILEAMSGQHSNVEKIAQALAPEYTDVEDGAAHSREEVLRWEAGRQGFWFEYADPQVVVVSPTDGYVVANVHYVQPYNGAPLRFHRLMTTVFTLRDGRWLATLHTEMPIDGDRESVLATPVDSDPNLIAMRKLAAEVMAQVHVPGYGPFPVFNVSLDAGTGISFASAQGAHEADFKTLPPPMQGLWNQWASFTTDEPSGEAMFKDQFYRFFLVHELGHLIAERVIEGLPEAEAKQVRDNVTKHRLSSELAANRIAVAWFREHDPGYLARLMNDFRLIQAHLPNPVPAGLDAKRYFSENYARLGADPVAYGWFQSYMLISVYEEPAKSFQQIMDGMPKLRYEEE